MVSHLPGSMSQAALGPVLSLIYVNDIDDGLLAKYQSAYYTKIAFKVTTTLGEEALQSDLDRLARPVNQWQIQR